MHTYSRKAMASLLLALFSVIVSGTGVHAYDCPAGGQKEPGLMTADMALARPAGAVATIAGLAIFVVSSPFSALGGNSREAWESLVVSPADYTFKRPLGHFDCEQPPREKQK
jgi:hypothetical protein